MAMGQQKDRQGDLMVGWSEMPRSPGHVFYDRLQLVLIEGGFDGFAEVGLPALLRGQDGDRKVAVPPGRYFAYAPGGLLRGYRSERGLESGAARIPCRYGSSCCWRCGNRVPDHSWLSRTRARRSPAP